tara:strand:+ start:2507 stop:3130 length:624 start_codon:yes stop_codon:yes gene_type:complete
MATLDPSNVVNGNIIEASDIEQLYNALGTGSLGFTTITGLVMTGSLKGSATSIIIPSPATSTGTYYPTLVPGVGTQNLEIGTLEYNAATDTLTTTASYAVTALNASVTQVNNQRYDDGSTILSGNFKFVAGKVAMVTGTCVSTPFTVLIGKKIGQDAFITANYTGPGIGPTDAVIVDSIDLVTGEITFTNNGGGALNATVIFNGIYI